MNKRNNKTKDVLIDRMYKIKREEDDKSYIYNAQNSETRSALAKDKQEQTRLDSK